jgi:hypothetical protein
MCLSGLAASPFVEAEPVAIRSPAGAQQKFRAVRLRPSYQQNGVAAGGGLPKEARPLALATADFNGDGYPDLVAGYATSTGGLIAVHFANPEAFAPSSAESLAGVARGDFPPSFGAVALTIPVAAAPNMLAVGDFNHDGNPDPIFASTGGNRLYLVAGDGHGGFAHPVSMALPGAVTALAAGRPSADSADTDVWLGVDAGSGPQVLRYRGGRGGLSPAPTSFAVGGTVSALSLGQLDDDLYTDVAMVAGGKVSILHGTDPRASGQESRMEAVPASFRAVEALTGSFIPGQASQQIAVLCDDGTIRILSRDAPTPMRPMPGRKRSGSAAAREYWTPANTRSWSAAVSGPSGLRSSGRARLGARVCRLARWES